jgi:hypothetical protein
MNPWTLFGTVLFIFLTAAFAWQLYKNEIDLKTVNHATWLMFSVVGLTHALISIMTDHGYWLAFIFSAGCFLIFLGFLHKSRMTWKSKETLCALACLLSFVVWHISKVPEKRSLAAVLTLCLAGLPLFIDLQRNPDIHYCNFWILLGADCFICSMATYPQTLRQNFVPGMAMLFSGYMCLRCFYCGEENARTYDKTKT